MKSHSAGVSPAPRLFVADTKKLYLRKAISVALEFPSALLSNFLLRCSRIFFYLREEKSFFPLEFSFMPRRGDFGSKIRAGWAETALLFSLYDSRIDPIKEGLGDGFAHGIEGHQFGMVPLNVYTGTAREFLVLYRVLELDSGQFVILFCL